MNIVSPMEFQMHLHQQMLYRQQQMTLHHHRPEDMPQPNEWILAPAPGAGPRLSEDVKIELQNKRLWQQFHAQTTEMIITKLGRRMFPSVQLSVAGLETRSRYCLLLEVEPASRRRHKYVGGGGGGGGGVENAAGSAGNRGWTSAGPSEPQPRINRRVYLHPDSPATGHHWMQHPVSFSKLKLTNNAVDHHNNVVLTSMHKYVPKIWIIRCDDLASMNNLYSQPSASFTFDETEFIAVTAYQNENITKLKIDNNPFAKGFRETGQSRCKRKLYHLTESNLDENHPVDEDEGNDASSSESESTRTRGNSESDNHRPKRALSETGSLDDSGVSSFGGTTPPLVDSSANNQSPPPPRVPDNHHHHHHHHHHHRKNYDMVQQPLFHRPWTDLPPPQVPKTQKAHPNLNHDFHLMNPFLVPSHNRYNHHHHNLAALELARLHHQMQRYPPLSHLPKFYR